MDLKTYKRLIRNLRSYKGKVILVLLTSVIVGALSTSPVPLVKESLDRIFVDKDYFMLKLKIRGAAPFPFGCLNTLRFYDSVIACRSFRLPFYLNGGFNRFSRFKV